MSECVCQAKLTCLVQLMIWRLQSRPMDSSIPTFGNVGGCVWALTDDRLH